MKEVLPAPMRIEIDPRDPEKAFERLRKLFERRGRVYCIHDMRDGNLSSAIESSSVIVQTGGRIEEILFRRSRHVVSGDVIVTRSEDGEHAQRLFNIVKVGPETYWAYAISYREPIHGYGFQGKYPEDDGLDRRFAADIPNGPC
jgi:hypothetical protein